MHKPDKDSINIGQVTMALMNDNEESDGDFKVPTKTLKQLPKLERPPVPDVYSELKLSFVKLKPVRKQNIQQSPNTTKLSDLPNIDQSVYRSMDAKGRRDLAWT